MRIALLPLLFAVSVSPARGDDWPQWLGPKRDGVWRETGIVERFPKGGPKVRWRVPLGGGYAGPAVVAGKVFVTDRVLAPGRKTPPTRLPAPPPKASSASSVLTTRPASCCGSTNTRASTASRTRAGRAAPRSSPAARSGRSGRWATCSASTRRAARSSGRRASRRTTSAPLPLWGFAANPLLDGDKLICLVGGKGSVVVAFDKDTGVEKWKALSFEKQQTQLGYCPPMIYRAGGVRQLIVWNPETVNGLNPETGERFWSQKFPINANLAIATPRLDGDKLLITSFYNGARLYRLDADKPTAHQVWASKGRGESPSVTDNLNSIMCTPFIRDGYIYGVCSYGELRCLKLADGSRVWQDLRDRQPHGAGRALGQRLPGAQRRPLVPVQREGRPHHRQAVAEGLRGDRPRPHPRTDEPAQGPLGRLVAPGVRQQVDVRAQRQGDRLRVAGEGVRLTLRTAPVRDCRKSGGVGEERRRRAPLGGWRRITTRRGAHGGKAR